MRRVDGGSGDNSRYAELCYSDLPYPLPGHGLRRAARAVHRLRGRYPDLEYPVLIGYFAYGAAVVDQARDRRPDVAARSTLPCRCSASTPRS